MLQREAFNYTEKLVHRGGSHRATCVQRSIYREKLVHIEACAHENCISPRDLGSGPLISVTRTPPHVDIRHARPPRRIEQRFTRRLYIRHAPSPQAVSQGQMPMHIFTSFYHIFGPAMRAISAHLGRLTRAISAKGLRDVRQAQSPQKGHASMDLAGPPWPRQKFGDLMTLTTQMSKTSR